MDDKIKLVEVYIWTVGKNEFCSYGYVNASMIKLIREASYNTWPEVKGKWWEVRIGENIDLYITDKVKKEIFEIITLKNK